MGLRGGLAGLVDRAIAPLNQDSHGFFADPESRDDKIKNSNAELQDTEKNL